MVQVVEMIVARMLEGGQEGGTEVKAREVDPPVNFLTATYPMDLDRDRQSREEAHRATPAGDRDSGGRIATGGHRDEVAMMGREDLWSVADLARLLQSSMTRWQITGESLRRMGKRMALRVRPMGAELRR